MSSEGSLKQKTITNVFWSIGDQFANQGIQFILQIVLARILLPEHFGIIGMILVFILISNTVIDSGFSQALIREQKVSQADYSTVFYFNLLVSFLLYVLLYVSAPMISGFFNEESLVPILRILSLSLIINALSIIQRTILTKELNFKTQTKINCISGVLSGIVAIYLALVGFGVWSLVVKTLSLQLFQSIFLWIYSGWKPTLVFKFDSFKRLFGFGSKLMIADVISIVFSNIFFVIIGKMYSPSQLGYYTNSVKITEAASISITAALQRVTYPVLSTIQDDEERLRNGFRKIIRVSAFVNFPIMIGLAAIAEPLIHLVFGEKWEPMVIYFQLLCIAGMLYPLHAIELNILQVKGKSNIFLYLSIARKAILLLLIIGVIWFKLGVVGLLAVIVMQSFLELILNGYFAGREISYSLTQHLKDISVIYVISIMMGFVVFVSGFLFSQFTFFQLVIQIFIGGAFYIGVSMLAKVPEWAFILNTISPLWNKILRGNREEAVENKL